MTTIPQPGVLRQIVIAVCNLADPAWLASHTDQLRRVPRGQGFRYFTATGIRPEVGPAWTGSKIWSYRRPGRLDLPVQ